MIHFWIFIRLEDNLYFHLPSLKLLIFQLHPITKTSIFFWICIKVSVIKNGTGKSFYDFCYSDVSGRCIQKLEVPISDKSKIVTKYVPSYLQMCVGDSKLVIAIESCVIFKKWIYCHVPNWFMYWEDFWGYASASTQPCRIFWCCFVVVVSSAIHRKISSSPNQM